ncbi:30S ribosomal protein S8 [Coniosporium apollinis CBS 100218]|uniref:30S ribosomal protein S8 n=1 Tax=Coniosporium apollinis (strain CBS 100218) TaxID=1168221 RepID=R7YKY5_CONA1|nr:30S ribosomal protein S8 [Coniosporium apollinis CBS 100218]EON62555.1 30S ribosomal protein S8 [Coniosporium apollinis CBS 100218]
MSLVNLAHVCSHLQNASKARLGLTSIPLTNLHLRLMLGLQKQGFISSVQLGGPAPPLPEILREPEPELPRHAEEVVKERPWELYATPEPKDSDALLNPRSAEPVAEEAWAEVGSHGSRKASSSSPSTSATSPDVPANAARRRLWLGLKYWNNDPVISKMGLVSKPTKRIWLNSQDIGKIARGFEAGYVKGLTRPGECLFVSTDRGVLEARECAEKKVGGLMLCRVY